MDHDQNWLRCRIPLRGHKRSHRSMDRKCSGAKQFCEQQLLFGSGRSLKINHFTGISTEHRTFMVYPKFWGKYLFVRSFARSLVRSFLSDFGETFLFFFIFFPFFVRLGQFKYRCERTNVSAKCVYDICYVR